MLTFFEFQFDHIFSSAIMFLSMYYYIILYTFEQCYLTTLINLNREPADCRTFKCSQVECAMPDKAYLVM